MYETGTCFIQLMYKTHGYFIQDLYSTLKGR